MSKQRYLSGESGRLAGSRTADYVPGKSARTNGIWSTAHEMNVLDYMATAGERPGGSKHADGDNQKRLKVWLAKSLKRRWDHGVNVGKCQEHANQLLRDLGE